MRPPYYDAPARAHTQVRWGLLRKEEVFDKPRGWKEVGYLWGAENVEKKIVVFFKCKLAEQSGRVVWINCFAMIINFLSFPN